MSGNDLVEEARAAIARVFADRSVARFETMGRLREIQEEVEARVDALQEEIRHESRVARGGDSGKP